jgi:CDP-glycerol glycerophosphotransferase (TagB/SpsB family)|tara:strand:- start:4534 stop:5556 length:1023 start_codon:yes stop_codon:yes gene_type:complete
VVAVEQALQKTRVDKVVLLMTDPNAKSPFDLGKKTIRIKKTSPAGLFWFCTARYVFFTHPCFAREFPKDVVSVNIWHGMPIKRIGWMLEGEEGIRCSHTLATSEFWMKVVEESMRSGGKVVDIGLPRNDRLFSDRSDVLSKIGLGEDKHLFAWLPTYRKSVCGDIRSDGIDYGNLFAMPDIDPEALNAYLETMNAVLVVKPHPMAEFTQSKIWSHLKFVDHSWFSQHKLSLYEFLGATDLLISDISSVVIDYLLLDRPVIHAFSDLEVYKKSRGFSVEPVENYFVGPAVRDSDGLIEALEKFFSDGDLEAEKRREMINLCHTYKDSNATRRLIEEISLLE